METARLLGRLVIGILIACFLLANLKKSFSATLLSVAENDTQGWHPVAVLNSTTIATTTTTSKVKVVVPPFLNRTIKTQHKNKRRHVFLIHVGKTGGETVRHTLKITCRMRKNEIHQQACWDAFNNNNNSHVHYESELSKHTIGTMHCDLILPKKAMDRATTLLWTIRNPLTRIISWFRYLNPINCNLEQDYYSTACNTNRSIMNNLKKMNDNNNNNINNNNNKPKWTTKFFWMCFPTMNDFARALGDYSYNMPSINNAINNNKTETSTMTTINCTDLAWRTIRGTASPSSSHAYFNYKYYWQETVEKYPDLEVWVLRTEYLWEDLDGVEELLLSNNPRRGMQSNANTSSLTTITTTTTTTKTNKKNVTHGSEGHARRGDLTNENKRYLCCALKEEMVYYQKILLRATNLNDNAKNQVLSKIIQDCNNMDLFGSLSSSSSSCSRHGQQQQQQQQQ